MGFFELSAQLSNHSPVYVQTLADGTEAVLFRTSDRGNWMIADARTAISTNMGQIVSTSAEASLPSEAGLQWKWTDGKTWHVDIELTVAEVRRLTSTPPGASRPHPRHRLITQTVPMPPHPVLPPV